MLVYLPIDLSIFIAILQYYNIKYTKKIIHRQTNYKLIAYFCVLFHRFFRHCKLLGCFTGAWISSATISVLDSVQYGRILMRSNNANWMGRIWKYTIIIGYWICTEIYFGGRVRSEGPTSLRVGPPNERVHRNIFQYRFNNLFIVYFHIHGDHLHQIVDKNK